MPQQPHLNPSISKSLSPEDVIAHLRSGSFNDLLGALETDKVDFKEQPYQLTSDRQKYSLLEDVTAFANHLGGIIVIGCRTTRADVEGDFVESIRPVPQNLLDFETYRSLLNEHIHPIMKGVGFLFFEVPTYEAAGIAVIHIPQAAPADSPHLVSHVITDDTNRKLTTKYALVSRTGARNNPYPIQTIHGLIRVGSSVSALEAAVRNIEAQLAVMQSDARAAALKFENISLADNRSAFLKALPDLLTSSGFAGQPALVLAAYPSERLEMRDIYDSQSELGKTFDQTPELRENGFDFSVSTYPRIVDGSVRRKYREGYKLSQLSISGRYTVIVRADDNFLGWALNRKPGNPVRYRSFVLAEVTFLFARHLKQILKASPKCPEFVDLMVALRNSYVDGHPPLLGSGRDHGPWLFGSRDPLPAPKADLLKTVRVKSDISEERLAYEVRAALYHRFGYGDEAIPYATVEAEGRVTHEKEITDPNRV